MSDERDESRPTQQSRGFYLPRLFTLAIERCLEEHKSRLATVVEFLRVQDHLAFGCGRCGGSIRVRIFTVAEAERCCELALSGKRAELVEEIDTCYGEYIAICHRCGHRKLLPLWLPPLLDIDALRDGASGEQCAPGPAATNRSAHAAQAS